MQESITRIFSSEPCVVVDVGARGGFDLMKKLHGWMRVFAIEPEHNAVNDLKSSGHRFHERNVYGIALGQEEGKRQLYITKHASMSSLLEPDFGEFRRGFGGMKNSGNWMDGMKVEQTVEVNCTTLQSFAEKEVRSYIDFLKLDTQGTELEILKSGAELLKSGKIGVVCTEVALAGLYKNQCSFSEVDLFLRECGYHLVELKTYPEIAERENSVHVGRRLYERPRSAPVGDAWYVCDRDRNSAGNSTSRTRAAFILAAEGYYSEATFLLDGLMSAEEMNSVFRFLGDDSFGKRMKHFAKQWTPPAIQQFWSKLKK